MELVIQNFRLSRLNAGHKILFVEANRDAPNSATMHFTLLPKRLQIFIVTIVTEDYFPFIQTISLYSHSDRLIAKQTAFNFIR